MQGPDESGPGRAGRSRDPEAAGPGLVTGLIAGFVAGVALVSAQPGVGDRVRDFASEFGLFAKASASSPGRQPQAPPRPAARAVEVQRISFAQHRPLTVGVFGDSMADGLWAGLYRQMRDGKTYEVVKFSRASTGLARYDYVNVQDKTAGQIAARPVDIAVICVGANDGQGIVDGKQVYAFNSPGWRRVYAARIDALVTLLRSRGAVVYWVGLPRMQKAGQEQKAEVLNAIFAERMQAMGVTFIPIVAVTSDATGGYNAYLPSGGGKKLMRAQDGVHMTMAGYLRIAAPVSSRIERDVALYSPPAAAPVTTAARP